MSQFIPYLKAKKLLEARLGATTEEIAAWVFMGPVANAKSARNKDFQTDKHPTLPAFQVWSCLPLDGLAAYTNDDEHDAPPRFFFEWDEHGHDYLAPLMGCWFREQDVAAFRPQDRYITGARLIERWKPDIGGQVEAFIRAKIAESRLIDIHPTAGATQWSKPDAPPKESALFVLAHAKAIEIEDGIELHAIEVQPATEQAESYGTPLIAWDELTPEAKRSRWNAMSAQARRKKAVELVKKHNGSKTAAGDEVGISRERMGQLSREGIAEAQPEAPLPVNKWTQAAGMATTKRGKASR